MINSHVESNPVHVLLNHLGSYGAASSLAQSNTRRKAILSGIFIL